MLQLVLLLLSAFTTQNESAKILAVFPVPFISHQFAFRPLTQELAKRGHEVTIITTDPAFPKGKTPANISEIDVHEISYKEKQAVYATTSTGKPDIYDYVLITLRAITKIIEKQFKLEVLQQIMNNEKYDLVIIQSLAMPALIFSHIFKIPVIQISSFTPLIFEVNTVGGAWHPILHPMNLSKQVYNLTMLEKLLQIWRFTRVERIFDKVVKEQNAMLKNVFGPDTPTIEELRNNIDMLFLNCHPIWDHNRPMPPNVVYLGGMHIKPEKELPVDLKNYLDSSKNGVIFMSFGSNVIPSLLPAVLLKAITEAFSKLPYDVLWKFDAKGIEGLPDNVRIMKWLPQSDLLKHPKIKVFITQGGLQSTDEAIIAGVPLIGIPMNSDQYYNVEQYVHHNIGVQLDINHLTEEIFRSTILNVVDNENYYRHNMARLRDIMYDQPMPPLERAVWWTEYVIRHGGAKHLRSPAANTTWTEYFELEIMLILLAGFLITIVLVFTVLKICINLTKERKVKRH